MRPYAGNYEYEPDPELMLDDRHFVQLMAALRICFPRIGMSVSTREPEPMRNALMHLGMTHMSACPDGAGRLHGGGNGHGPPDGAGEQGGFARRKEGPLQGDGTV